MEQKTEPLEQTEKSNQEPTQEKVSKPFDKKEFDKRMNIIREILALVSGGVDINSRIDPILSPKKYKTTSNITRGELSMIISLLTFAQISPEETMDVLVFCENFMITKLSEGGFGIEKAIELGRALTQETVTTTSVYQPQKPIEGMKKEVKT